MRAFTPEISWHNRLPTLSLDISHISESEGLYRVATGGNDCRVYIWHIYSSNLDIRIRAGLRRHQKSVGAVRFSFQQTLASGDDDGYIYLWKQKIDDKQAQQSNQVEPIESNAFLNDDGFEDLETWQQYKVLRGHIEDICDLAWSKDGQFLLSGSVDNSAILWDATKGTKVWCSDLIKGYVQGVALDPHAQFMAALSSDRTLRIFNYSDKRMINATRRMNIKGKFKAFFCDDTVQTFCRRFEFSPDGQFLIAPTSRLVELENNDNKKPINIFLVFKRNSLNKPVYYYPTGREVSLCTRFSPVVYKLKNTGKNLWDLPYRLVFAVATSRSVLIYDTQQATPIAFVSQIHLARLTDLSWSNDGKFLMISSYDGYTTMIFFGNGEIGEVYDGPLLEPVVKSMEEVTIEEGNGKADGEEKPVKRGKKRSKEDGNLKETPPKNPTPKKRVPNSSTMWRYLIKRE